MTLDQIIARIRRAMLLDVTAYEETRDDATFTLFAVAAAGVGVVLAAIGAWLYGETVIDDPAPGTGFVDTVILGTIFTGVLFIIGALAIYLLLGQVFGHEMSADGLFRIVMLTYLPFGLGLLVFIPEFGFAFGLASVAATFYYTIFGIRAAYPSTELTQVMLSVLAGFAVWALVIPFISDYPNDNFVTGVFVYSLFD